MGTTSVMILTTGIDAMVNMLVGFLTFALTNWIPILIAIVVVVGVIGLAYGKIKQFFHPGGK
jgi:hypothetical protein